MHLLAGRTRRFQDGRHTASFLPEVRGHWSGSRSDYAPDSRDGVVPPLAIQHSSDCITGDNREQSQDHLFGHNTELRLGFSAVGGLLDFFSGNVVPVATLKLCCQLALTASIVGAGDEIVLILPTEGLGEKANVFECIIVAITAMLWTLGAL